MDGLAAPLEVMIAAGPAEVIKVSHITGNQGVFVESVMITGVDAADFTLTTPVDDPFLIPVAGNKDLSVDFIGAGLDATALLEITHSGGQTIQTVLLPEPGVESLVVGLLALGWLGRGRRRSPSCGKVV